MKEFVSQLLRHFYGIFSDEQSEIDNPDEFDFKTGLGSLQWPLSRKINPNPNSYKYEWEAEAWELYINDMEVASGASDLNDPHEQYNKWHESYSEDPVTCNPYDENYIEALECGALPWAGVGIGIDRLCMLLLGKSNIREVLMFPTLKNI
jgi:lysyl-tRNA synthetase class 2